MRRHVLRAASLGATLSVVGCNLEPTVPSTTRTFGLVSIPTVRGADGVVRTQPIAQFFRGNVLTLPDARQRPDSCIDTIYQPAGPLTNVTHVDAGSEIVARIGARADTLRPVEAATGRSYILTGSGLSTITPGDSAVVRIPGAAGGFPALELRGKTAEAFTIDPIPLPAAGQGIPLRWTAPADPNGAMLISLRYSPPGGGGVLSRQLNCIFVDNGTDSVPARVAALWATLANNRREVVASRLRTVLIGLSGAIGELIAYYQITVPVIQ